MKRVRCAIYTRKSSDEGLDQAFNSLDAQREACAAYIASQRHEGWKLSPARFDDGGLSGGTLDRPALQALLEEIDAGRLDMVVVYKIDRLTRSLADFARIVERLEAGGASFVSVTQSFNTSTSMGRLTLNVLLSFAQFEREVTAERIRDKIAASKKKGMWMGGPVPLGYDKSGDGLVINPAEAETVRVLFNAYVELGCVRRLENFADERGLLTKTRTLQSGSVQLGKPFSRGRLYHLLSNPIYIGKIKHRDTVYDGLHGAIVDAGLWDHVQTQLATNRVARRSRKTAANPSPLAGKLFDDQGRRLTPSHAVKSGRRYRYYVSKDNMLRLPATEVEAAIHSALENNHAVQFERERRGNSESDLLASVARAVVGADEILVTLTGKTDAIAFPMQLQKRGVEQKLVLGASMQRDPDKVLIGRILFAMDWIDQIESGQSVSDVADAAEVSPEYVTHTLGLALLSPSILEEIGTGRQAPHITASQLKKVMIPAFWPDQRMIFPAN